MKAGIALGSNLGDRLAHLKQARDFLRGISIGRHLLAAPVYETAPMDCAPGTPAFLNSVVEIESDLPPHRLLETLQGFEQSHGRPREHGRNAPRTIDLDVLYFGELVLKEPRLTLPHPRLNDRRFVLQPLADIQPEMIVPGLGMTPLELLDSLGDTQPIELVTKDW